jgi:hypothetical protein
MLAGQLSFTPSEGGAMPLHHNPYVAKMLREAGERLAFDLARPKPMIHVFTNTANPSSYTMVEDPISGQRHYSVDRMLFHEMEDRIWLHRAVKLDKNAEVVFHRHGENRAEMILFVPHAQGVGGSGELPMPGDYEIPLVAPAPD